MKFYDEERWCLADVIFFGVGGLAAISIVVYFIKCIFN